MQLLISAGLIALIVLWGLIAPASLGSTFDQALVIATKNFGWLYLWVVFGLVLLSAFLALSRYGDLKLGAEDEEPEFSLLSWFAMLFAAGMGIGLVYWGVAEPLLHYRSAPPGIVNGTPEAANAAMRYSFFHWGLHHGVRFMVVAPSSTIDMELASGEDIPIEEREGAELLNVGGKPVGADVQAFNPVFDVTPADLIDVIVTEKGIIERPDAAKLTQLMCRKRLH